MKKVFKNIFLGLALTACTATPFAVGLSFFGKNDAGDASVKNDGSYVLVDELWNDDMRTFNKSNVNTLLKYMGLEGKTLSEITTSISTPKNASDFRAVEIDGKKTSSQDINVMLGGLEWTVCYLSQDKSGNPTLTLWLSNSTQDAFAGRSETEGEHYGYVTDSVGTGLYSDWSYNWWNDSTSLSYPSAMYGTSYVRAVTLNNGGKYALSGGETLSAEVEQDSNSAFAIFTMKDDDDTTTDLTDYITTPSEMSWQENQSTKSYGHSYNLPNDAWGIQDDAGFYTGNEGQNYNYSTKENYDTWKNDKLWLPSMSETGYNTTYTGLWQTSVGQRKNYDGSTIFTGATVGTNNDYAYSRSWLRSGYYYYAGAAYALNPSVGLEYEAVSRSRAVCPSLHLDLSGVFENVTNQVEVAFNTNGGIIDEEKWIVINGLTYGTLPTPIKEGYRFKGWFLDEELTQPVTSETVVTNSENHTLYAKWGDLVEYKTYYDYFIDNMDCTGVYDDNGNLTNVTISAEKKAEILSTDFTGSGTSTDPYQVNSSLGFWYMTKFVNLGNKYVELNCDVILNDEHFDENGDVIVKSTGESVYGDGIVYQWEPINNGDLTEFNGNNHVIYNLYFNDSIIGSVGLFKGNESEDKVCNFRNLKMDGTFINCFYNGWSLKYTANLVENCTFNGTINAGTHAFGACCKLNYASNCENYVNLNTTTTGGVCAGISNDIVEAKNCKNYGNMTSGQRIGGLFGSTRYVKRIENCQNYGDIETEGGFVTGGIIASSSNYEGTCIIIDCINYGKLSTYYAAVGGIVGLIEESTVIENCKNYGEIIATNQSQGQGFGEIVGEINDRQIETGDLNVVIKNCQGFSHSVCPLVGSFGNRNDKIIYLNIIDCYLEIDNDRLFYMICTYSEQNQTVINVNNFHIKVLSDKKTRLYYDLGNGKRPELNIKNLFIECESDATIAFDDTPQNITSAIVYYKNGNSYYYGLNFSGFYIAWRTGKIGLKALDGVGYFQGAIDEEWLANNGFVKKN